MILWVKGSLANDILTRYLGTNENNSHRDELIKLIVNV